MEVIDVEARVDEARNPAPLVLEELGNVTTPCPVAHDVVEQPDIGIGVQLGKEGSISQHRVAEHGAPGPGGIVVEKPDQVPRRALGVDGMHGLHDETVSGSKQDEPALPVMLPGVHEPPIGLIGTRLT